MNAFELRLAEHHSRNARHLKNLRYFSSDPTRFSRISPQEQSLVLLQIEQMAKLDEVLVARMKLHNIPV